MSEPHPSAAKSANDIPLGGDMSTSRRRRENAKSVI